MDKNLVKQRLEQIKLEQELLDAEQRLRSLKSNMSRSRSVTVGTAFGGTTEISMRGDAGEALWCLLQPVEAIELIHQLAANVGCHIAIKPREDFSSWRGWKVTEEEKLHLQGHPPFAGEVPTADNVGASLPPPEQQPGMKLNRSNDDVVATKKTVDRRNTKRAAKTS
jgi:hypothetical protein